MPHSTYLPERMGTAVIEPAGSFEAGSFQSFTLTYTAGVFRIDDTGSIKVAHRFVGGDRLGPATSPARTAARSTRIAVTAAGSVARRYSPVRHRRARRDTSRRLRPFRAP